MELSLILRLIGALFIVGGLIIVVNPELIVNKPVPSDPYAAIERRIWWGAIIGVGVLLMFQHQLLPWQPTVAATLACLLFGMLVARLVGIGIDGSIPKQWLWVGVELVLMLPFVWWYWKSKG